MQPVLAILAQQGALAARALRHTGDVNEAGLLVGAVMSRAFKRYYGAAEEGMDDIPAVLGRDLEDLISRRRYQVS